MITQLCLAGATLFVAAGLAISQALDNHYWAALVLVDAGIFVAGVILVGRRMKEDWFGRSLIAAGCLMSLMAYFDTKAFDFERQAIHRELFLAFAEIHAQSSLVPFSAEESKLLKQGLFACALQSNADMQEATIAGQKAIYLGPGLSLADAAYDEVAAAPEQKTCLHYYQILRKRQPSLFIDVERKHATYLATKRGLN